ncbi:hypothetical protein RUND412_000229 [Rhizina undulata]
MSAYFSRRRQSSSRAHRVQLSNHRELLSAASDSQVLESESRRYHPRSEKRVCSVAEVNACRKRKIRTRNFLAEDKIEMTNGNAGPRSLQLRKHKFKPRTSASTSTLASTTTGTSNSRNFNVELLIRPAVAPFSFHQEKWLFLHITGNYPWEHETIDWHSVCDKYKERFTVGRTASSFEMKWKEMKQRGVNIGFYEHKEEPSPIRTRAQSPIDPIFSNRHVPPPAACAPSPAACAPSPNACGLSAAASGLSAAASGLSAAASSQSTVFNTPSQDPQDTRTTLVNSNGQSKGNSYTAEEKNWLLKWVRRNIVNGEKKSWKACDEAFTKKFKYSRGSVALMLKYGKLSQRGMKSVTRSRKKRQSTLPSGSPSPCPSSSPFPSPCKKRNRQLQIRATASASPLVTRQEKITNFLRWSKEHEQWLISYCYAKLAEEAMIDWEAAVEDYSASCGIVRSANALKKKWERKKEQLQASNYNWVIDDDDDDDYAD